MAFPAFIHTQTPQGPMPKPMKVNPLNLSPLIQLAAQRPKPKTKGSSKGSGKDKGPDLDALPGHASQMHSRIQAAQAEQQKLAYTWGLETATTMPEWSAAAATKENAYNDADRLYAANAKADWEEYNTDVGDKGAGGLYHLGEFHRSNGKNTVQHRDALFQQKHGASPLLGGKGNFGENYDEQFDYNPNFYSLKDATDYMDQIYNPAMNKYQTQDIYENFSDYVSKSAENTMMGMMSTRYKEENNQAALDVGFQELLDQSGMANKDKMYFMSTGWDESSPLVQGLEQGFLQQTQGGQSWQGVSLRKKNGEVDPEKFSYAFGKFASDLFTKQHNKRRDEHKELDKTYTDSPEAYYQRLVDAEEEVAELMMPIWDQDFQVFEEQALHDFTMDANAKTGQIFDALNIGEEGIPGVIEKTLMPDGRYAYNLGGTEDQARKAGREKIDKMKANMTDKEKKEAYHQLDLAIQGVKSGKANNPFLQTGARQVVGGNFSLAGAAQTQTALENAWVGKQANNAFATYFTDGQGNVYDSSFMRGQVTEVGTAGILIEAPSNSNFFTKGHNTGNPAINIPNPEGGWAVKDGIVQNSSYYDGNWNVGRPDFTAKGGENGGNLLEPMDRQQAEARYNYVQGSKGDNAIIPHAANTHQNVGTTITYSKEEMGENWEKMLNEDLAKMKFRTERNSLYPKKDVQNELNAVDEALYKGQPGYAKAYGGAGYKIGAGKSLNAMSPEQQAKATQALLANGIDQKTIDRVKSDPKLDAEQQRYMFANSLKWKQESAEKGEETARKYADRRWNGSYEKKTVFDKGTRNKEWERRNEAVPIIEDGETVGYKFKMYAPMTDLQSNMMSKNKSSKIHNIIQTNDNRIHGKNVTRYVDKGSLPSRNQQPLQAASVDRDKVKYKRYFKPTQYVTSSPNK